MGTLPSRAWGYPIMNTEGTRHDEQTYSWHVWRVPKGLSKSQAGEYFDKHVKPSTYMYDELRYDPVTGTVRTA